jgi:hypothetical protein
MTFFSQAPLDEIITVINGKVSTPWTPLGLSAGKGPDNATSRRL